MRKGIITMAIASIATIALLVPASAASPRQERLDRERHEACDPSGRWELDLDREGSRIEVDYEVTSGPAGERWKVEIQHDGVKIFDGSRMTRLDDDDRPDFETDRSVKNHAGTDHFWASARNAVTGAVCRGGLSI